MVKSGSPVLFARSSNCTDFLANASAQSVSCGAAVNGYYSCPLNDWDRTNFDARWAYNATERFSGSYNDLCIYLVPSTTFTCDHGYEWMLSAHHFYNHTFTPRFSMQGILVPIQDAEIAPVVPRSGELVTIRYEVPLSGDGPGQEQVALAASAVESLKWSLNGSAFYTCPMENSTFVCKLNSNGGRFVYPTNNVSLQFTPTRTVVGPWESDVQFSAQCFETATFTQKLTVIANAVMTVDVAQDVLMVHDRTMINVTIAVTGNPLSDVFVSFVTSNKSATAQPVLTAAALSFVPALSPVNATRRTCDLSPGGVVSQRCNVTDIGFDYAQPTSVYFFFQPEEQSSVGTFDFDVEFESEYFDNVTVPVQVTLTGNLSLELMDAGNLTFFTGDMQTTHFRVSASHMSNLFGEALYVRADVADPNVGVAWSLEMDSFGLSEPCVLSDVWYICRLARNDSSPVWNNPNHLSVDIYVYWMPKPTTVGPLTTTQSEPLFLVNATLFDAVSITPAYSQLASLSVVSTPKAESLPSQQRFYVHLSVVSTGASLGGEVLSVSKDKLQPGAPVAWGWTTPEGPAYTCNETAATWECDFRLGNSSFTWATTGTAFYLWVTPLGTLCGEWKGALTFGADYFVEQLVIPNTTLVAGLVEIHTTSTTAQSVTGDNVTFGFYVNASCNSTAGEQAAFPANPTDLGFTPLFGSAISDGRIVDSKACALDTSATPNRWLCDLQQLETPVYDVAAQYIYFTITPRLDYVGHWDVPITFSATAFYDAIMTTRNITVNGEFYLVNESVMTVTGDHDGPLSRDNVTVLLALNASADTVGEEHLLVPAAKVENAEVFWYLAGSGHHQCPYVATLTAYICHLAGLSFRNLDGLYLTFIPKASTVGPLGMDLQLGARFFQTLSITPALNVYGTFHPGGVVPVHAGTNPSSPTNPNTIYFNVGDNITVTYTVKATGTSTAGEQILVEAAKVHSSSTVSWSSPTIAGVNGTCVFDNVEWYVCTLTDLHFQGVDVQPDGVKVSISFLPAITSLGPLDARFGFRATYFQYYEVVSDIKASAELYPSIKAINPVTSFVGTHIELTMFLYATTNSTFGNDRLEIALADIYNPSPNISWSFDGWITEYGCFNDSVTYYCNFSQYGHTWSVAGDTLSLRLTPSVTTVGTWNPTFRFEANNFQPAYLYPNATFEGRWTASTASVTAHQGEFLYVPITIQTEFDTILGGDQILIPEWLTASIPYWTTMGTENVSTSNATCASGSGSFVCGFADHVSNPLRLQANVPVTVYLVLSPNVTYLGPQSDWLVTIKSSYFQSLTVPLNVTLLGTLRAVQVPHLASNLLSGGAVEYRFMVNSSAVTSGGEVASALASQVTDVRFKVGENGTWFTCPVLGSLRVCSLFHADNFTFTVADQDVYMQFYPLASAVGGWAEFVTFDSYHTNEVTVMLNATVTALLSVTELTMNATLTSSEYTSDNNGTHFVQGETAEIAFGIESTADAPGGESLLIPVYFLNYNTTTSSYDTPYFGLGTQGAATACTGPVGDVFSCDLHAAGIYFRIGAPLTLRVWFQPPVTHFGHLYGNFTFGAAGFQSVEIDPSVTILGTLSLYDISTRAGVTPDPFAIGGNVTVTYTIYPSTTSQGLEMVSIPVGDVSTFNDEVLFFPNCDPLYPAICPNTGSFYSCNISYSGMFWNTSGTTFCVQFSPSAISIGAANTIFYFTGLFFKTFTDSPPIVAKGPLAVELISMSPTVCEHTCTVGSNITLTYNVSADTTTFAKEVFYVPRHLIADDQFTAVVMAGSMEYFDVVCSPYTRTPPTLTVDMSTADRQAAIENDFPIPPNGAAWSEFLLCWVGANVTGGEWENSMGIHYPKNPEHATISITMVPAYSLIGDPGIFIGFEARQFQKTYVYPNITMVLYLEMQSALDMTPDLAAIGDRVTLHWRVTSPRGETTGQNETITISEALIDNTYPVYWSVSGVQDECVWVNGPYVCYMGTENFKTTVTDLYVSFVPPPKRAQYTNESVVIGGPLLKDLTVYPNITVYGKFTVEEISVTPREYLHGTSNISVVYNITTDGPANVYHYEGALIPKSYLSYWPSYFYSDTTGFHRVGCSETLYERDEWYYVCDWTGVFWWDNSVVNEIGFELYPATTLVGNVPFPIYIEALDYITAAVYPNVTVIGMLEVVDHTVTENGMPLAYSNITVFMTIQSSGNTGGGETFWIPATMLQNNTGVQWYQVTAMEPPTYVDCQLDGSWNDLSAETYVKCDLADGSAHFNASGSEFGIVLTPLSTTVGDWPVEILINATDTLGAVHRPNVTVVGVWEEVVPIQYEPYLVVPTGQEVEVILDLRPSGYTVGGEYAMLEFEPLSYVHRVAWAVNNSDGNGPYYPCLPQEKYVGWFNPPVTKWYICNFSYYPTATGNAGSPWAVQTQTPPAQFGPSDIRLSLYFTPKVESLGYIDLDFRLRAKDFSSLIEKLNVTVFGTFDISSTVDPPTPEMYTVSRTINFTVCLRLTLRAAAL